jgi:hypothetical protein
MNLNLGVGHYLLSAPNSGELLRRLRSQFLTLPLNKHLWPGLPSVNSKLQGSSLHIPLFRVNLCPLTRITHLSHTEIGRRVPLLALWRYSMYCCLPMQPSHCGNKSRHTRTLWDRIVSLAFCGCLLLFLHALAGLGESPSQNPLHTQGSQRSQSTRTSADVDIGHTIVVMEDRQLEMATMTHKTASVLFPTITTAPNPIPTSITTSSQPTQTGTHAEVFRSGRPLYGSLYDPFDLGLFDTDEYDNDGQPFAIKIHVQDPSIIKKRAERCQASGGLRCQR